MALVLFADTADGKQVFWKHLFSNPLYDNEEEIKQRIQKMFQTDNGMKMAGGILIKKGPDDIGITSVRFPNIKAIPIKQVCKNSRI